MLATTDRIASVQKHRMPLKSETLQLIDGDVASDAEIGSDEVAIVGTGVGSSIMEVLQRSSVRQLVGTASPMGRNDPRPQRIYSGQKTFHSGSMALSTLVERISGFGVDVVVHVAEPTPLRVGGVTCTATAVEAYYKYFGRDGLGPTLRQGGVAMNVGGAYIQAHERMRKPDLTARIALRLAEIPYMARAEDSVLPNEDVVNAAVLVSGYLPATTVLPQIEIDDSTGSISLVWRDDLHDNVFSLEIPNSRYVVGVGYGKDFSNFKPWRHRIFDERKIVSEIETSEAARKLLSGA